MTYSGYSGNFTLRNGAFLAIKLYGNCSATTTTYSPLYDGEGIYEDASCEAIFLI